MRIDIHQHTWTVPVAAHLDGVQSLGPRVAA
jgi:hypothetical protein